MVFPDGQIVEVRRASTDPAALTDEELAAIDDKSHGCLCSTCAVHVPRLIAALRASRAARDECERQFQDQVAEVIRLMESLDASRADLATYRQEARDEYARAEEAEQDLTMAWAEMGRLRAALDEVRAQ